MEFTGSSKNKTEAARHAMQRDGRPFLCILTSAGEPVNDLSI